MLEYHPSPSTNVFAAVTDEVYANAHVAELQFERYFCWTIEGFAAPTVTEFEAPSVNESPRVSVGAEGAAWLAHPTA